MQRRSDRFGPVVLGSYFLLTREDLDGLPTKRLRAYADQIACIRLSAGASLRPQFGKEDKTPPNGQNFAGARDSMPRGADSQSGQPAIQHSPAKVPGRAFSNCCQTPTGLCDGPRFCFLTDAPKIRTSGRSLPLAGIMAVRLVHGTEALDNREFQQLGWYQRINFGINCGFEPNYTGQMLINYQGS